MKFYESSLKINKRWHYFIQWVVNIWNSLSSRCCIATNINRIKKDLDKFVLVRVI